MTNVLRFLTVVGLLCGLVGCNTPGPPVLANRITLNDQWCQRHFGEPCPKVVYRPPQLIQPPTGPVPDIHLTQITCDVQPTYDPNRGLVWVNLVTANVSNDGDADAVPGSNGNSVTVTVVATLRRGGTELAQGQIPGSLFHGNHQNVGVGPFMDWSNYSHVSVSADTNVFNAERNYSNNALQADVQTDSLPDSKPTDTIYCKTNG
jgi:hypothetical protein